MLSAAEVGYCHFSTSDATLRVLMSSNGAKRLLRRSTLCSGQSTVGRFCACPNSGARVPASARTTAPATDPATPRARAVRMIAPRLVRRRLHVPVNRQLHVGRMRAVVHDCLFGH